MTDLLIPVTRVLWFDGKEFREMDWPTFALPSGWREYQPIEQNVLESN